MFWGENEKAGSVTRSWTQNTWLVLCHWATTAGQPPALTVLSMYCTGGTEMPQSHTRQPLSMCRQNPVGGWPESSLHQERTHAEWFSLSRTLASCKENLHVWGENRGKWKGWQSPAIKPRTPGLCCQLPLSYDNRTTTSFCGCVTTTKVCFCLKTSKFSLFQHEARVISN